MLKFIGSIFAGGIAVGAGSLMVLPLMLIAVIVMAQEAVGLLWPGGVCLLIYGLALCFLLSRINTSEDDGKILAWTVLAIAVGIVGLVAYAQGEGIQAYAAAALAVVITFALGIGGMGGGYVGMGGIAGIQLLWLIPLYILLSPDLDTSTMVMALIGTLLGMIGAFFAADALDF